MDDLTFLCKECGERYIPDMSNSVLYGPVIHTTCPFCYVKEKRNFTRYMQSQFKIEEKSYNKAIKLIELCRMVQRRLE